MFTKYKAADVFKEDGTRITATVINENKVKIITYSPNGERAGKQEIYKENAEELTAIIEDAIKGGKFIRRYTPDNPNPEITWN